MCQGEEALRVPLETAAGRRSLEEKWVEMGARAGGGEAWYSFPPVDKPLDLPVDAVGRRGVLVEGTCSMGPS